MSKMSQNARKVFFQLDYYMSSQFAGVAMGLRNGIYDRAGIKLQWLPPCPPGEEAKVVEKGFAQDAQARLWVGCMEQNTLLPAVASGSKVKAVAAMFGKSPLCLAGLPGSQLLKKIRNGDRLRVAAHIDTVELLERMMPHAEIKHFDREDKMSLLLKQEVDAIQAYDVMETVKLEHHLPVGSLEVLPLEGPAFPGVRLGYSQVLFAPSMAIMDSSHRQTLHDFVQATFQGWGQAIREPRIAADAVLQLQPRDIDHWIPSLDFTERSVRLCGNYVKSTIKCGQLGVIDVERWKKAVRWLDSTNETKSSALDETVWSVSANHIDGHCISKDLVEKTLNLAEQAKSKHGQPPQLIMISVGRDALGKRHIDGERRLQLFASPTSSWFSMKDTGAARGIEVIDIDLPADTTTEGVLREIWRHSDADGITVTWPLPQSVDAERICAAIPVSKDVDGVHFLSRAEAKQGFAPATCAAVIHCLKENNVMIEGKRAVVIGSSCLLGRPMATLLSAQGAAVTMLHSRSKNLEEFCKDADLVIAAAGVPRLVKGDWIKNDAAIINVGTTFQDDTIVPDIAIWNELRHASLVVRTVGPLSATMLLHNVAQAAVNREIRPVGATADTLALDKAAILHDLEELPGWALSDYTSGVQALSCDFWLPTYKTATDFVQAIGAEGDNLNHHPNIQITHHCVAGVTVNVKIFTHAIAAISAFDCKLAQRISFLYRPQSFRSDGVPNVSMRDFRYELPESSIAQFPASPRGSSRLLVALPSIDDSSRSNPKLFGTAFGNLVDLLPQDAHLVCNASQVFAARIFAEYRESENPVEVMFLSPDPPDSDPTEMLNQAFHGQTWRCMVRYAIDTPGCQLNARINNANVADLNLDMTVELLHSAWKEEGEADGVEATIRISCSDASVSALCAFGQVGHIPLPPYMRRESQELDNIAYQTVYSSGTTVGSVAAPTAGLHFSLDLMDRMQEKGLRWSQCALHVGAGTFRPVITEKISQHAMHTEVFSISVKELEAILGSLRAGRGIVAVGTTSVRVLESLYWLGVAPDRSLAEKMSLGQWDPYAMQLQLGATLPDAVGAFQNLHTRLSMRGCTVLNGSTSLCIVPGYDFKVCDGLVTNFHQPDSTLMLLVSAFAGKDTIKQTYEHALKHGFRFLSYGDSSLLFRQPAAGQLANYAAQAVSELEASLNDA